MYGENVSNEQLLEDIENTKAELDAYDKIQYGFGILSRLPENADQCIEYTRLWIEYDRKKSECSAFLQRLYGLKYGRCL